MIMQAVPAGWMPAVTMKGIVVHWTAGAHKASEFDRKHYHVLIEADGNVVRGIPTIDMNASPLKPGYAAHTLHCNTGWIGVSLCCMAEAIESPFDAGSAPMTRAQWDALPAVLAALCRRYRIPVTAETVLSHAEVQDTLKIPQKGKWDIARLAFEPSVKGAHACGDIFRSRTRALIDLTTLDVPIALPSTKNSVAADQQRLFDAGYTMVGRIDGIIGVRGRGAIRIMQEVNHLPITGELDPATVAVLRGPDLVPMPISPERRDATADTIRDSAPIVAQAETAVTVAKVGTFGTGVLGFGGFLTEVSGQATTLKAMVGDVPPWLWFLLLLMITGVTGFLWWQAGRIKARRVEMHRAGETA